MKNQATMIYLLRNDCVLFLERHKKNDKVHKQGMHIGIGGKVEKGESAEECIKREVLEESGIKINNLNLKAIIYFRTFGKEETDWIDFIYTSDDFKGEAKNGNEGNFLWVKKNEISKLNLYEGDKIFLDYLFKYDFFVLELLYENFILKDHKLIRSFS